MAINPDPASLNNVAAYANRPVLLGNIYGVTSMVTWAAAFPAAEYLLATWSPTALITVRLLIAVAFLFPVWLMLDGPRAVITAPWKKGLWVGGLGFGIGTYLILVAQDLTDPVTVALIASCAPLAGTLLEVTSRQRKLSGRFVMGMGASIIGGIIATNTLDVSEIGIGAGCAVVSVLFFSWGSDKAVRVFQDLTPIGRTTLTLAGAFCAICLVCVVLFLTGHGAAISVSPSSSDLLPLAIYAVVSMAVSQAFWIGSVGKLGVAMASFHMNVAPFYVMLILLFLGQGWDWSKALGAMVVGLGVIIAQSQPRKRAPRPLP